MQIVIKVEVPDEWADSTEMSGILREAETDLSRAVKNTMEDTGAFGFGVVSIRKAEATDGRNA